MHVVEMRMLKWMCVHTMSDNIRNEVIKEKVGVGQDEGSKAEIARASAKEER